MFRRSTEAARGPLGVELASPSLYNDPMHGETETGAAAVHLAPFLLSDAHVARLVHWFRDPDVARFYREEPQPEHVRAKFGPRTRPESRVKARLIQAEDVWVGYAQFYLLDADEIRAMALPAEPSSWGGFDLFIGEGEWRGRGLGRRVVRLLLHELFRVGATDAAIDCDRENAAGLKAYEAAGLTIVRLLPAWSRGRDHWLLTGPTETAAVHAGGRGA